MADKLAIILSGGGMKCGWGAGILCGLNREFGINNPDVLIGCSGSAGTSLYYLSEQYGSLHNAWTSLLSKKNIFESFISWGWKGPSSVKEIFDIVKSGKWKDYLPKKDAVSFFNSLEWKNYSKREIVNLFRLWKIIDVDYLVDEIFKKYKSDLDKIYFSETNLLIPALDIKGGEIKYFSNKDEYFSIQHRDEIIDAVRASMKMPLVSGFSPKDVLKSFIPGSSFSIAAGLKSEVYVKNGYYCDSILTSSAQTHIEKAVNQGANKILVIDHDIPKKKLFDREKAIFNRWLNHQGNLCQSNYHNHVKWVENYVLPDNIKTYTLEMPRSLIGTLDNSEKLLRRSFDNGYDCAKRDRELYRFLEKEKF
jgi:predicted patatin/cPLA2 family phospholipase